MMKILKLMGFLILILANSTIMFGQRHYNIKAILNKAVDLNPAIKSINYGVAVSNQKAKISRPNYLPSVNAHFSQLNSWINSEDPTSYVNGAYNTRGYNTGFQVDWTIFDGNRAMKTSEVYGKQAKRQSLLEVNMKNEYIYKILKELIVFESELKKSDYLSEKLANNRLNKRQLDLKLNKGVISKFEYLQKTVHVARDSFEYQQQIQNQKNSLNRLVMITKMKELNTSTFDIIDDQKFDKLNNHINTYKSILDRNPRVAAQKLMKESIESQIKAVDANRFPELKFQGGYNYNFASNDFKNFGLEERVKGNNGNFQMNLVLTQNIFNANKLTRQKSVLEIEVLEKDYKTKAILENLDQELMSYWQLKESNYIQLNNTISLLKNAEEYLNLVELRYLQGVSDYATFSDAKQHYSSVLSQYIEYSKNWKLNWLKVLYVTNNMHKIIE